MALSLSPPARHQLTNGVTAFSLGVFCFIRRWYDLENLQPRGLDYFRSAPPGLTLMAATILSAILLAAVFWGAWYWVERSGSPGLRRLAHVSFLLLLAYSVESVRRYWNTQTDHFDSGSNISLWVVEAILVSGCVLLFFNSRRVLDPARRVAVLLLLLFPALMIDFVMNRLGAEQADVYQPKHPAPLLPDRGPNAPRFVWLVFDELDEPLAFERRPPGLDLPELDRLRGESVAASHAVETSTITAIALPSLICGRIFSSAQARDSNTLDLYPRGSRQKVDWSTQPTVFSRARQLGVNAALAGWHHPYCRILGDQLTECFALPSTHSTAALAEEAEASRTGVWRTVAWLFQWQFATLRRIVTGIRPGASDLSDAQIQRGQQQEYLQIRDHAYRDIADPRFGLVLVHFPTPHMFPIYNRREQNFHIEGSLDYFDNLALVDRTVGEVRRTLEQAGLWDRTSLLVTADHGLRPSNWIDRIGWTTELDRLTGDQPPLTVPFIVKLAGQSRAIAVDKSFSNVAASDLALQILDSKLTSAEQVAAWMNQLSSDEAGAQAVAANGGVAFER